MHVAENYLFNDFLGSERSIVSLMSERVFELNVKNPAFAKQKNSSNAKFFFWRTTGHLVQFESEVK